MHAWEIESKVNTKIFCGIPITPSFQYIHLLVQEAWDRAWKPPNTERVFERSHGVASAREKLAEKFLASDATHFLMLDGDIVIMGDTIARMLQTNKPVVLGRYMETSNNRFPEAFRHSQVPFNRCNPIDFKKNEIFEFPKRDEDVILAGLGIMMIKREVFEKLDKPYFLYSSEYGQLDDYHAVCVLPHQLIYGEIPKYIEELESGYKVYSGDGEFNTVEKITSRNWNGKIIEIIPRTIKLPIKVTPDHRMPIYRFGEGHILCRADEINPLTDYLYMTIPSSNVDVKSFGLYYEGNIRNDLKVSLPESLKIDDKFLEFLGKYVSDGSIMYDKDKIGGISLAFDSKKELAEMEYYSTYLSNLTNRKFKIEIHERGEKSHYSASVRGSCNPLARKLAVWFGRGAQNKYLPSWVINLPPEKIIPFLRGVWAGDGFQTYSGIRKLPVYAINLSSEKLILGIALCLLKLGITFRISEHIQPDEAFGHGNKFWRLVISRDRDKFHYLMTGKRESTRNQSHNQSFIIGDKFYYKIEKLNHLNYSGLVYDLRLGDDSLSHTFMLRGTMSHNSEDFFFCLRIQDYFHKTGDPSFKIWYFPDIWVWHMGNAMVGDGGQIAFV